IDTRAPHEGKRRNSGQGQIPIFPTHKYSGGSLWTRRHQPFMTSFHTVRMTARVPRTTTNPTHLGAVRAQSRRIHSIRGNSRDCWCYAAVRAKAEPANSGVYRRDMHRDSVVHTIKTVLAEVTHNPAVLDVSEHSTL